MTNPTKWYVSWVSAWSSFVSYKISLQRTHWEDRTDCVDSLEDDLSLCLVHMSVGIVILRLKCNVPSIINKIRQVFTWYRSYTQTLSLFVPQHNKTDKMSCAPSLDQPEHPQNLIRVSPDCMKNPSVLSYPLSAWRRPWSDWMDAQAYLSLRWAHRLCRWFCHAAAHLQIVDTCTDWPNIYNTCLCKIWTSLNSYDCLAKRVLRGLKWYVFNNQIL